MAEPAKAEIFSPPAWMRRVLGPLATRPRLISAIAVGLVAAAAFSLVPNALRWSTRAILSWDGAALCFVAATLYSMRRSEGDIMRGRAAAQDEGRHFILGLVLVAAAASLGATGVELSLAKSAHGLEKSWRVGLAVGTVALSWLLVHLVFALHYAHEYYAPDTDGVDEDGDGVEGGLGFPGDEDPDYWDFLHFALVIGVASQTADVAFESKPLRRIGTIHGVISFVFNTVVLALTINLAASLF